MDISKEVKLFSDLIAARAIAESEYFPVDRKFLEPLIPRILQFDPAEFILYNAEKVNPTYTNILFACLPEVWVNIDIDELFTIIDNFSNAFSYFIFIEFIYKYIGIDILIFIIQRAKHKGFSQEIKNYLKNQWNVLIKFDLEADDFGYDPEKWNYIKQKLLLDTRVKPALQNHDELFNYISTII